MFGADRVGIMMAILAMGDGLPFVRVVHQDRHSYKNIRRKSKSKGRKAARQSRKK